jgi:hypothetical protein
MRVQVLNSQDQIKLKSQSQIEYRFSVSNCENFQITALTLCRGMQII